MNTITQKPKNQEISYQDALKQIWNRKLVIWELRYGAKFPHVKKRVNTLQRIADMYDYNFGQINMILVRMRKRAKKEFQV